MRINVVTLFPELFDAPLRTSIMGRAVAAELVEVHVVNLRDFTDDKHQTVDDYPYGGGAGMVLKPEPFFRVVEALEATAPIALLSARGRQFAHDDAVRYSVGGELTILCGHYKDIDARVGCIDGVEEIAVGEAVLSGGEFAAMCVLDAVIRLLPGALGDHESASSDSYYEGLLSPPSYTRPATYREMAVPDILLSGDHAKIEAWRQAEAERLTQERRPDLWDRYRSTQSPNEEDERG